MRYVDIYRDHGSMRSLIASDCIQYGEVLLSRSPITKTYTMADGRVCMYAASSDTASMTLQLECGQESAERIAQNARLGMLVIAGMNCGTDYHDAADSTVQYLPVQEGRICYITGTVQMQQKSLQADIYTVSIPLQLAVNSSGGYQTLSVPAIKVTSFMLGAESERLDGQHYRYEAGGRFVRKQTIITAASEIAVQCTANVPDGEALLTCIRRTENRMDLNELEGAEELSGVLSLEEGLNQFILTARKASVPNYKPQYILFSVYREEGA